MSDLQDNLGYLISHNGVDTTMITLTTQDLYLMQTFSGDGWSACINQDKSLRITKKTNSSNLLSLRQTARLEFQTNINSLTFEIDEVQQSLHTLYEECIAIAAATDGDDPQFLQTTKSIVLNCSILKTKKRKLEDLLDQKTIEVFEKTTTFETTIIAFPGVKAYFGEAEWYIWFPEDLRRPTNHVTNSESTSTNLLNLPIAKQSGELTLSLNMSCHGTFYGAVHQDVSTLFVSDTLSNCIRTFCLVTGRETGKWGGVGTNDGEFDKPLGIVISNNLVSPY